MMNGLKRIACVLSVLSIGACASNSTLIDPCCYTGEYVKARFHDVYLRLDDGGDLAFSEVFDGFEPDQSVFSPYFPMRNVRIGLVTFAALRAVLPEYDANENGHLEEPELTVLYIREAARGFGHDVSYIGTNPRVDALVAARADVGGLIKYLDRTTSNMNEQGQAIFRDLRNLVYDARRPFVNGRNRKIME